MEPTVKSSILILFGKWELQYVVKPYDGSLSVEDVMLSWSPSTYNRSWKQRACWVPFVYLSNWNLMSSSGWWGRWAELGCGVWAGGSWPTSPP